ncbi:MAG: aminopeptidase N [Candidatus Sericytochromatia bacterium]|nr:aminopeptidase N [Candidatus Sericytochromatia bacterium]
MPTPVRSAATVLIAALLLGLPAGAATLRPAKDLLTYTDAAARARIVSQLAYDLQFTFEDAKDHYSGQATITFACTPKPGDLTLDYTGGQVRSVVINGMTVPVRYNKAYIVLPGTALKAHNSVTVTFDSAFDTGGVGMTRFVDPADQRTYIYSDFEPYGAHHLFPCFDQPDLKGTYTVRVDGPKDWEVITNVPTAKVYLKHQTRRTVFAKTPPLSTYLFALHTGQYISWHGMAGDIPMGIYARASLAKSMVSDTIFETTRKGLDFYGKYFDFAYPFGKYDQVFVPELPEGAMENPGAVTMNENMIYRHQVTASDRFDRDDTILHEMAHMWFGDLVTMNWWNGLWLNESFATYMASLSQATLTSPHGDSWAMFFKTKEWAYDTDDRVTTHPIETQIDDTNAATENFDGITYGKGASVMKQLAFYLGPDAFRDGVRTYFKRHAYKNTTLPDFMGALQTQSKHDLSAWTSQWLKSAGLNTVEPAVLCSDGKIQAVTLTQTSASGETVGRPHRTEVGLFDLSPDGRLRLRETVPAGYDGSETAVAALTGKPCAPLLFANVHDQDYAKVRLDSASLQTVKERLSTIEDPFIRQQLWSVLWYMVRDQKLDVISYVDLLKRHLPAEANALVVESQLGRLETAFAQHLDQTDRQTVGATLEPFVWEQLSRQMAGSDAQLLWADTLIRTSQSPHGLQRLVDLVRGTTSVPGLVINQDLRWQIVRTLTASNHAQASAVFDGEQLRDVTDRGLKAVERIRAAEADATVKAKIWQRILTDRKASLGQMEASMEGFWNLEQATLLQPYVQQFFDSVPAIFRDREPGFASSFYKRLYPVVATTDVLQRGEALLKRTDLSPELRRKLLESNQDVARRLHIQVTASQVLANRARPAGR